MKSIFYISVLLGVLFLGGCRKTPSHVIPPGKMASLLTDIYKSESTMDMNYKDYRADSSKIALREAIYRRHKVTEEDFDTSLYWYGHNIEEYMNVYDDVIERLQKEIDLSDAEVSRTTVTAIGDSVDAWMLSPRFAVTNNIVTKNLSFELFHDDNWEKGDNYTWNIKIIHTQSPVEMLLGAAYEDGLIEWITNTANENGRFSYTFVPDSTKNLERVFGNINFTPQGKEIVFVDSISLIRTRTNRQNYHKRFSQKKVNPKVRMENNSATENVNDSIK